MPTITITLPDEVAAQIEAKHISQQQLDAFVVTSEGLVEPTSDQPRSTKYREGAPVV